MDINRKYYNSGKKVGWWRRGGLAFKHYAKHQLFKNIDFTGSRVLDIGCGSGVYSIYAAMNGAKEVIGLEPSKDGSRGKKAIAIMENGIDEIGLTNVKIEKITLQEFEPGNKEFDIILSGSSINHLNESACIGLLDDPKCWEAYRNIAKKIRSMTATSRFN